MRSTYERPLRAVPKSVVALLAATLIVQIAWQAAQPRPVARASQLSSPPPISALRAASLGEPIAMAQLATLYLQAFDNQPGISIPFRDLDYARVVEWLSAALALDRNAQYPLLLAAQIYSQVPVAAKQRAMLEFVHRQFAADPDRRWRWLAHAALMARHRLHDLPLALRYADDIARNARAAPHWARQMHILIRADMGEREAAQILLGGLLASGEIEDEHEYRFLAERLEALKHSAAPTALVPPH